jgi:hypothetical protein
MINDKELSRLRAISHAVVASANGKNPCQCQVTLKRQVGQVELTVNFRPGSVRPSDALSYLGDLADAIRSELRLEQTTWGKTLYRTTESEFSTEPSSQFNFIIRKNELGAEVD